MLDWRSLPLRLAATLAAGLPEDSVELVDEQDPARLGLTAAKLVREGRADILVKSYDSPEEFEAALAALKEGG